ncbi:DUF4102 domain-containing protein [Prodigiosinella confusarubida]|uniref:DUF4102 domain-containing protein n=1 Tax=Serratia sp. (strain ATCC 39006) TaxID=104623 RepID=A0A2I5T9J4_SERS3|nr:DUF4102 domain-containing protein [Serratia sp. ATCC 39006]AUH05571.1 DUF4102 domain-containing protein [Serratia sp. ATCC 39006]
MSWGVRGRRFKSSRADQISIPLVPVIDGNPTKPAFSLSLRVFCCLLSAGLLRFQPESSVIRLVIPPHITTKAYNYDGSYNSPLSNTEIKAAKPAEKEYTLQDGDGLYLLVKPSGSKIWRFNYYRPDTKKRALTSFGSFPAVSLAEARQRRESAKALISKGIDPHWQFLCQKDHYRHHRILRVWRSQDA